METEKIGFLVLPSIGETLELIAKQDERKAWKTFHALYEYATKGIEPQKNAPLELQITFTAIRGAIDNAKKRFLACAKNGKKGGRPKKNEVTENAPTNKEQDEPPKEENLLLDFEQNTDFSQLAKGLQINEPFIKSQWEKFKTEVQFKQKVHHDLNDLRGHFISWLNKKNEVQTASTNEPFAPTANHENEYFANLENSNVFQRLSKMYNVLECYITDYYKQFKEECEISKKTHKSSDDLQNHFVRWLGVKTQHDKESIEKAQRDKEFTRLAIGKMQLEDSEQDLPFM